MFALPGLPALAAKSRGNHPCRKAAERRVFYGTESVTDEKLVVNGAEVTLIHVALWLRVRRERAAASYSQEAQTVLRSELYQKFPFANGLSG